MNYHEQISGWFDFAALYDAMVDRARDGAAFVEVGAYLGRSTVYLASRIQQSGKKIRLYVVDLWDGWVYREDEEPAPESADVFAQFFRNVRRAGIDEVLCPLRMPSEEAADLFDDGTLDFVFLDADHGYQAVRRDLQCWFPKVKRRGFLGGHDYLNPNFPGVRRAVDEFFTEQELPLQINGTSFLATKPSPRWLNAAMRAYRRLVPVS